MKCYVGNIVEIPTVTNMLGDLNFEVTFEKYKGVGIYSDGNYIQRLIFNL
jgi:hypothetical protein